MFPLLLISRNGCLACTLSLRISLVSRDKTTWNHILAKSQQDHEYIPLYREAEQLTCCYTVLGNKIFFPQWKNTLVRMVKNLAMWLEELWFFFQHTLSKAFDSSHLYRGLCPGSYCLYQPQNVDSGMGVIWSVPLPSMYSYTIFFPVTSFFFPSLQICCKREVLCSCQSFFMSS